MLFLEITVDLFTKVTKKCIKLIQLPCFYSKLDHKNCGAETLLEILIAVHPALSELQKEHWNWMIHLSILMLSWGYFIIPFRPELSYQCNILLDTWILSKFIFIFQNSGYLLLPIPNIRKVNIIKLKWYS